MSILALVTARAGSKRLPGKNVRLLGGRPLVAWSIDVAKGIPEVCDILVSTDGPDIAEAARNAGALVPWSRPAELSSDVASSVDVALHALDWYEGANGKVDGLLLLQPTSPFRTRDSVLRGIALFQSSGLRPVVAVSPAESHPLLCFTLDGDTMLPFVEGRGAETRSQDLPPAYADNGSLYLLSPDHLRQFRSFYGKGMVPLVISSLAESLDIDTELDWVVAEVVLGRGSPVS